MQEAPARARRAALGGRPNALGATPRRRMLATPPGWAADARSCMIGWAPSQSFERKHPPLTPAEVGRPWGRRGWSKPALERKAPDPQGSGRGLPLVPRPQGLPGYRPHHRLVAECSRRSLAKDERNGEGCSHCQLRGPCRRCPGPPRSVAILSPRRSVSRCSARCRSWPSPLSRLYGVKRAIVVPNPGNGRKTWVFGALRGPGRFLNVLKALQPKRETGAPEGA